MHLALTLLIATLGVLAFSTLLYWLERRAMRRAVIDQFARLQEKRL